MLGIVILRSPDAFSRDDEGSLHLLDFTNTGILRGVYPERSEWAQNDMPKTFFNKLLGRFPASLRLSNQ